MFYIKNGVNIIIIICLSLMFEYQTIINNIKQFTNLYKSSTSLNTMDLYFY